MKTCIGCGRELPPEDEGLGVCATCRSPEALAERIAQLPGPLRGTMERVGKDMGILDRDEPA